MEPEIKVYISTNIRIQENVAKDFMTSKTICLGTKLENNGYYIQAEGGYGNATQVKAEVGKDFNINDSNFGINTSIGGIYTKSNKERDYYHYIYDRGANSPTWKPNDKRNYAQVAVTYKTTAFKASAGVQYGIKYSNQPSLEGINLAPAGEIIDTEYAGKSSKKYITPIIGIEGGKKLGFSSSLSLQHFEIGGKFYF